jgi:hypothetical protein
MLTAIFEVSMKGFCDMLLQTVQVQGMLSIERYSKIGRTVSDSGFLLA